jgi:SAM-dependent methyltransferase
MEPPHIEGNPLLRAWVEIYPEGAPFNSSLRRFHDDRDPLVFMDDLIRRNAAREENARRYAWAVPTDEALAAVARRSPLVEVGAGTGYWAALLARLGVDVVAYDAAPPPAANHWHAGASCWFPVEQGGPEKVDLHPDRALFLCWPPYDDPMAADALRRYAGQTVIFVGEGGGGCTADEAFHDQLERDFAEVERVALPQWEGIHDCLSILVRK